MNKIAIITALSGMSNARIQDPTLGKFPEVDYYAFVDRVHETHIWQQIPIWKFSNETEFSDRRNAKLPKILGWLLSPGYDYYIWHDHYSEVQMHPEQILDTYLKDKDMALFKHPHRNCSYQEARVVGELSLDKATTVVQTTEFLTNRNWPQENGLFELTSFVYRNTYKIQTATLAWWDLLCKYSSRDQILFPWIVAQYDISYNYLPGSALGYGGNNTLIPQVRGKFD